MNRVVICVDGADYDEDGTLGKTFPIAMIAHAKLTSAGHGNASNVFKLKNIAAPGKHQDATGRSINQIVRYYQANSSARFGRSKAKSVASLDQQIKDITKDVVTKLENPHDEVYFFGFGRGAYIVRAVAALLHFMGMPKNKNAFDEVYNLALELEKAHARDDSLNGSKLISQMKVTSNSPPMIRFVGLFDTVKPSLEKHQYDISFVGSIQILRHALAFNESSLTPEVIEPQSATSMEGRSMVQAWFMGSHQDLGGGTEADGLSLHPYQWMVLEAVYAGLIIQPDNKGKFLELAFPQYTGQVPKLGQDEKIEWKLKYANDINVTMFDLASLHTDVTSEGRHEIWLDPTSRVFKSQRKIWSGSSKALLGWNETGPWGSIIHPSMYAILDRSPKMYDQGLFKIRKLELADFQERCLMSENEAAPWLEGLQLQASGVKAFRILVCGKTGVGKSTLINKVFGVEMTEESTTYTQGVHDINTAFESPNHPGLLIHDSRGWQAGSDTELDLIAKFLRHRAFQKDPAESLHVIWFCVDSDVSRIEEAEKRTFDTIAQYSHHVPVFVVGTKKDKLVAYRKMELLDQYMKQTNDYKEANKLATIEADRLAEEQFGKLRDQLSNIEHYKADGFCSISKGEHRPIHSYANHADSTTDDDSGVRTLLNQTLDLIADERVRLFCVAAQVMDVEQKIDSAITESMRLGTHAIRTAMVPLPFSGMIGTPTVSRLICEHVLQCFGFPKAAPDAVEEIMSRVVMGNLKDFMKVTLSQFGAVAITAVGVAVPTMGIGIIVGAAGSLFASPPTARMLFKCACDMILILERSFRYQGKYVSVKQIEDAAIYYTTAMTKTFSGKEVLLQAHVHDEIDRLIPLKKVSVGWRFAKLRGGLQDIIYMNRFDKKAEGPRSSNALSEAPTTVVPELDAKEPIAELAASPVEPQEVEGDTVYSPTELDSAAPTLVVTPSTTSTPTPTRKFSWMESRSSTPANDSPKTYAFAELDGKAVEAGELTKTKSEDSKSLFKRSLTRLTLKKSKSKSNVKT